MDQELYQNLKNCLSTDNTTRKNAESFINTKKSEQLPQLLTNLFYLISDESDSSIDLNVRQLSCLLFKNILCENNNWFSLTNEFQAKIKNDIYEIIEQSKNKEKIKYICVILANIAFKESEYSNTKIIENAIKKLNEYYSNENINNMVSYLFIIKTFFEKSGEEKLMSIDIINSLQKLIILIIKNISNEIYNSSKEIIFELVLDIYSLILPFLKFSFTMETDYVFTPIINLLSKSPSENILNKNLNIINDTINYYHRYIIDYIKLIIPLLFTIMQKYNKNKDIILNCLDILCLISDKELEDKTSLTNFILVNSEMDIPKLLDILENNPEYILDNYSWNISRAICYFISFIISRNPAKKIIDILLKYISENFNDINTNKKINSLLILSCCLESYEKFFNLFSELLQPEIINLLKKIKKLDNPIEYTYTISWILGKISEIIPSIFQKENFYELIPLFIDIISNNIYKNEIRINICIIFGNLIKYYGDEDTKKTEGAFRPYYKYFMNECIKLSLMEENIVSGLSFYLLRLIMNTIQYSSHDLQDSLEILLKNIMENFDFVTNNIKTNKNLNKDQILKLYQLQENLCFVINQIFNKIIRDVNIELCFKLYNSIIDSFILRGGKAYESGMLCLLNLIILLFGNQENVKNLNEDIFYKLLYAVIVNNDKEEENLKIIGILCLINLIKIKTNSLKKYIKELYEVLKKLSVNEGEIKIEDKTVKLVNKAIEEIENNKGFLLE